MSVDALSFPLNSGRVTLTIAPEMLEAQPHSEDLLLAQRCLEGEEPAIIRLRETYRSALVNYLIHAGATVAEAHELIEDLWAECLAERRLRRPRLATYAGNSPLQGWLKAVALNNLIQLKRRETRRNRLIREEPVAENDIDAEGIPAVPADATGGTPEQPLIEIIRGAVESAFRESEPRDFLLLQLVHAHGLLGRELAGMFGCSEAKICRDLEDARRKIVKATLSYVRERDPWLELRWEDFVELCRAVSPSAFGVE